MKLTDKEQIIKMMKDGWELGMAEHHGKPKSRVWLQKEGLRKGGESIEVHGATLKSMRNRELVMESPRKDGDPYWLTRYELVWRNVMEDDDIIGVALNGKWKGREIKARQTTSLAMTAGKEKKFTKIRHRDGRQLQWVGFGWVEE